MAKTLEETQLIISPNGQGVQTPMQMLAVAVSRGAGIDELGKLMDLQQRWEQNEARKAFVSAMNAFKANAPAINKNKTVSFGEGSRKTEYRHATLDHVCDVVTKALSQHGISHRWKVEQGEGFIKVTCILTHEMGHSEETTLVGTADNSGSKNSIQAVGSTVTYLQRYTLLAATGLAAGGTDDDGQAAGIPADKVEEQCHWISNAKDMAELQKLFAQAYRLAAGSKDGHAMSAFIEAKDKRKGELR